MATPAKYNEVISVIKRRIQEGDYLVDSIPGERRLAEETGVSYMTARRAVRELLDESVLVREPSGSLGVHPEYSRETNAAGVVLLYPAYPSTYFTQLRVMVSECAAERGLSLRPGQYVHWEEQALMDAVSQANGALIIPYGPDIPKRILEQFSEHKVAILDGDFSAVGLPSIRMFSEACIERVLDHIWEQGHRRVDCINTQNLNPEIERRIDIWERWLARRGCDGTLHGDPAPFYTDATILSNRLMSGLLDDRASMAPAYITTTCPAAIGAIRACYERGVTVGDELAIAAVNLEPPAEFYCPSITGLNTPKLAGVLGKCFDWFTKAEEWSGPLVLEPQDSDLFVGESTGAELQSNKRS